MSISRRPPASAVASQPSTAPLPIPPPAATEAELAAWLADYTRDASRLDLTQEGFERPIHGTTMYVATCQIETRFGPFTAHVFQDLIHKGYIIALAFGDITSAATLYTRMHSSCVTSETLRGCDCDCVQQLEGAIETIAKRGHGVLFYLLQEGRGVGYVAKSRDRMLVQASNDRISTFQAYRALGLKKDYREYHNVGDICRLLGIRASFVVLTNNPDKVEAMRAQGLKVERTETLEFEPGPYNLAYLRSKAESGHILARPQHSIVESVQPPEPVIPFKPYALAKAQRFIYSASYFLPVKPVDDEILLTKEEFEGFFTDRPIDLLIENRVPLISDYHMLRGNRFLVRVQMANLTRHARENPDDRLNRLLQTPYWFRVHVYYDIVTGQDFVVLTHGRPQIYDIPVVRLHSESIFNRFPLKDVANRDRFKEAVREIVHYGVGVIVLMYNDGRGAGAGAYSVDKMMLEAGRSYSTDESYRKLGVSYDSRDYEATMSLLKHHLPSNRIQMVMNSPSSLVRKKEYAEALNAHHIEVDRWIFLEKRTL